MEDWLNCQVHPPPPPVSIPRLDKYRQKSRTNTKNTALTNVLLIVNSPVSVR